MNRKAKFKCPKCNAESRQYYEGFTEDMWEKFECGYCGVHYEMNIVPEYRNYDSKVNR